MPAPTVKDSSRCFSYIRPHRSIKQEMMSFRWNSNEHKEKESSNLWQKATSLRQSFRKSKSSNKEAKSSRLHRHWSSQRNLTRERKSFSSNPIGDVTGDQSRTFGRKQSRSYTDSGDANEWEVAKKLFDMAAVKNGSQRHNRTARKLTKDSGYETSAQGDQDYGSIEWTSQSILANDRNRQSQTLDSRYTDVGRRDSLNKSNCDSISNSKRLNKFSSTESVCNWGQVTCAKSAPILNIPTGESPPPPYTPTSLGSSSSNEDMVTRRFKKGSVYGTLASNSGLDFSPVLHNRSYWENRENPKHESNSESKDVCWEKESVDSQSSTLVKKPIKIEESIRNPPENSTSNTTIQETCQKVNAKRSNSNHEKYPSWPVTESGILDITITSTSSQRSHSWTAHTEYPKETVKYSRPQKSYKILTSQLQPVLERPDLNKKRSQEGCDQIMDMKTKNDPPINKAKSSICIPDCRTERDCSIHSPPERDISSCPSKGKEKLDLPITYTNKYDDFLRHYTQHLPSPSVGSSSSGYGGWSKDSCTPFLDRLRLEGNALPSGSDVPSEASTWIGSAEDNLKWHGGSYSDLSTFSVQMSNRSSLFDSGHSTMPDSGRLSPQSSCSGSILSSRIETSPTRAQVVSRHGCHRESIAHSSRVQQPQRHDSESVVYYGSQQGVKQTSKEQRHDSKRQSSKENGYKHFNNKIENNELLEGNILKLRNFCSELKIYSSSNSEQKLANSKSQNKISYLDPEKKQSLTDPELKAIQKQAVLSYFQRQTEKSGENNARDGCQRRNSLPPSKWNEQRKILPDKSAKSSIQIDTIRKLQEHKVFGHYSKSVPNLCELRRPSGSTVISTSQSSVPQLKKLHLEGKVASLATIFDLNLNKIIPGECKDLPKDGSTDSGATSYFRSHKSPRKLQLKEVHQTDEAAKLKVFNSEGITLAETTETNKKQEKIIHNEPPQVPPRRIQKQPVTPIIRQPPTRPPPPPPPSVPSSPQSELDDQQNCEESVNNLSLQNGNVHYTRCASPDLPLPPPPSTDTELCVPDEPLPPPPDLNDVEILGRSLGQNSLVYPKNSYMSYRSEKKIGRLGFDGNYRRISPTPSFSQESNQPFQKDDSNSTMSPASWEQLHNIRQHGPTVIFHSDSMREQSHSQRRKNSTTSIESQNNSASNVQNTNEENSLTVSANNSDVNEQVSDSGEIKQDILSKTKNNGPNCKIEKIESKISNSDLPDKSKENSQSEHQKHLVEKQVKLASNENRDEKTDCNLDSNSNTLASQSEKIDSEIKTNIQKNDESTYTVQVPVSVVPRINSATQTTDTPSLKRKAKTREELECEKLSLDFIDHCHDRVLKNLLVPAPNQKTMSDYLEGLLDLELEGGGQPTQRIILEKNEKSNTENCQRFVIIG
ncbi:uncharacterized protein LOC111640766 isoform X1 [Centruroides sculpturatus]|uniref:uncharacterized protein LOC111640766 isoform X1 n=2 Tax=Centruroides sculpturatus TaxID=218467 RepID=UPI000C6DCE26|nr:uncharacterized protein LOC111640766 isoform X1 [Centruroides sculpturatus]